MSLSETKYYVDSMMVAAILSDDPMMKQAGASEVISGLISAVTNYVSGKIDPNNKLGSIFNILAPGMLMALGGMFRPLGWILEIAELFHFEPDKMIGDILSSLKEELMSAAAGGKPVAAEQVDAAANQAVLNNYGGQPTEEDLRRVTSALTLRDIAIYKIALADALKKSSMEKHAQVSSLLLKFMGLKPVTASIFSKILSWIVKSILISAGFMTAGAIWEHFTGPSTPSEQGAPVATTSSPVPSSTAPAQQLFKVNPAYTNEVLNVNSGWIEGVPPSQIANQLVTWAQDIYPDLRGKESFIESSSALQEVAKYIQQYNANNTSNVTFMPKKLTSRKQVVDLFIDDLALKAKTLAQPSKDTNTPAS